ncbi:family 16 glycosylhydrolase [Gynurincola endophyticus]|uniref:family 16 glycosylhydrolase n=1 Tax=Gynurincola endophyticus TaxID=2479004 RepID=UPI000F8C7ED3|nr:family 16 glycosylhydrolase [Gynurincola endophyticus]
MIRLNYIFSALVLLLVFTSCEKDKEEIEGVPEPGIEIKDVTKAEGNSGLTDFDFEVSFNRAFNMDITIQYTVHDGTAIGGEDFQPVTNGTLVVPAGRTKSSIVVKVIGDEIRENNETFTVELLSANYGVITRKTATGTIVNDDSKIEIATTGYSTPMSYSGYTLAWNDEFTDGFDANIWTNQNGNGCPELCGWGNNELEYYTARSENIYTQQGNLVIEARQERYQGFDYTSSKIITRDKKFFKYGRIDIRAQLPYGQGIWPAFWLMPQHEVFGGWPSSGEIDMMEMVGNTPNQSHGTLHYGPGPSSVHSTSSYTLPSGILHDEFHVYSLIWKEDEIVWLVDDIEFKRMTPADLNGHHWPFNEEFYMIINFAIGGNWPGNPNATTEFPQWLIVDYVRYFAPNP